VASELLLPGSSPIGHASIYQLHDQKEGFNPKQEGDGWQFGAGELALVVRKTQGPNRGDIVTRRKGAETAHMTGVVYYHREGPQDPSRLRCRDALYNRGPR
jgi:hypothetical protein